MNQPGLAAALLAGLLSFLSPCVLPLVPGYISFITGHRAGHSEGDGAKRQILLRSLAFVAGFSMAFTGLGIAFSGGAMFAGSGSGMLRNFGIASGVLIFLFGLNSVFDFLSFLNREVRFHPKGKSEPGKSVSAGGAGGAFVMGLAFAAGWSPCIGPILASILLYAGRSGNILTAAALLAAYSAGLAIPFLATGMFFEKLKPVMDFMKRHGKEVRIASGIFLMVFGAVMAAGSLPEAGSLAVRMGLFLQEKATNEAAALRVIGGTILMIPALVVLISLAFRKNKADKRAAMATIMIFTILAIVQFTGLIDFPSVISAWLLFQGI